MDMLKLQIKKNKMYNFDGCEKLHWTKLTNAVGLNCIHETELKAAKKFKRRFSNPNPLKNILLNLNSI